MTRRARHVPVWNEAESRVHRGPACRLEATRAPPRRVRLSLCRELRYSCPDDGGLAGRLGLVGRSVPTRQQLRSSSLSRQRAMARGSLTAAAVVHARRRRPPSETPARHLEAPSAHRGKGCRYAAAAIRASIATHRRHGPAGSRSVAHTRSMPRGTPAGCGTIDVAPRLPSHAAPSCAAPAPPYSLASSRSALPPTAAACAFPELRTDGRARSAAQQKSERAALPTCEQGRGRHRPTRRPVPIRLRPIHARLGPFRGAGEDPPSLSPSPGPPQTHTPPGVTVRAVSNGRESVRPPRAWARTLDRPLDPTIGQIIQARTRAPPIPLRVWSALHYP
eukprot:scaffold1411_cov396-Prasinococcus_capsulatus_cf.AAC.8